MRRTQKQVGTLYKYISTTFLVSLGMLVAAGCTALMGMVSIMLSLVLVGLILLTASASLALVHTMQRTRQSPAISDGKPDATEAVIGFAEILLWAVSGRH